MRLFGEAPMRSQRSFSLAMPLLAIFLTTVSRTSLGAALSPRVHAFGFDGVGPSAVLQLYVANTGPNVLYRFPLKSGIPSPVPASFLQLENDQVLSVAIGGDGSVYSGYYDSQINYFVDVFAPGATGNAPPIRTLAIRSTWLSYIWVDRFGYLYVSGWKYGFGPSVAIYAPGAHGDSAPVQVIRPPLPNSRPSQAARDDEGYLYVPSTIQSRTTYVYAYPLRRPKLVRSFCGWREAVYIAIDDENEVFEGEQQFTDPNHGTIPVLDTRDTRCPSPALRLISPTGFNIDYIEGVATVGNFLYASMQPKGGRFEVFTFDKRLGQQVPLSILTMDGLGDYAGFIGVGP